MAFLCSQRFEPVAPNTISAAALTAAAFCTPTDCHRHHRRRPRHRALAASAAAAPSATDTITTSNLALTFLALAAVTLESDQSRPRCIRLGDGADHR